MSGLEDWIQKMTAEIASENTMNNKPFILDRPMQTIRPIRNRILVDPLEAETESGGILIPEQHRPEMNRGKVVGIGSGRRDDNVVVEFEVQIGDTVIHKLGAAEVMVNGHRYRLVQEEDILAVIE